jgi:hypothetical protein
MNSSWRDFEATNFLSMILVDTPAFMRLNASIDPLGPAPTTKTSMKLVFPVGDCMILEWRWK